MREQIERLVAKFLMRCGEDAAQEDELMQYVHTQCTGKQKQLLPEQSGRIPVVVTILREWVYSGIVDVIKEGNDVRFYLRYPKELEHLAN